MLFNAIGKAVPVRHGLLTQMLLIMRLTAVILLAACLQLSAAGFSQTVTISRKDAPLEKVLADIKKQTGYNLVYANGIFKNASDVTINVKNASVDEALAICFKDQPLSYSIIEKIIVVKLRAVRRETNDLAAFININGYVVNEKAQPVAGASVNVKGTNKGVSTDEKGAFMLMDIDEDATLVITGVSIERLEIKVKDFRNGSNIQVKTKTSILQEVAITATANTGYQTITRDRATGAYDVIGKEVLSRRPVSNLSTALQGVVAGLQARENIDGTSTFLLRGVGTFNTDPSKPLEASQPLVVVDGFAINGFDFNNINPNDVESITILKDASASSIWGSRGANGVIVITTKTPRLGRASIELQAFKRISSMIDLDQIMKQAKSPEHILYEKMAFDSNWMFNPYIGGFQDIRKSMTLAQEQLYAFKKGTISKAQLDAELARLSAIDNRPQVRDLLMQRAILNQVNMSFSAATDKTKTSASILYENNKEGFIKRGYDRLGLNFNNNFNATPFLNVYFGANIQYRKNDYSGIGGGVNGFNISELEALSPYEVLVNPDGSYGVNLNGYNRQELSKLPLDKFPYQDWTYNLLREVRGRERTNEDISARLQAGINVKLLKGLTFEGKAQYEKRRIDVKEYFNEETFEVRNNVNTYVEYNDATKTVGRIFLPKGGILRSSVSDYKSYTLRGQFTYDRTFATKHQVTVIAGSELTDDLLTGTVNPTAYGYFPDRNQVTVPPYGYGSSVDQLRAFTSPTTAVTLPDTDGNDGNAILSWRTNRLVSFFSSAGYTFNRKYSISGSLRSDASNFITKNSDLRWSPLWSVGAMWNATEEPFLRNVSWLDRLNVRLTYGSNGLSNQSVSTETLVDIGTSPNTTTGTITGTISTIGNPLLRWEKTYSTNFGIDFSLLKNKLFGKIDVYDRSGRDIVGNIAIPSVTGSTSARINNATISNRGVELELGTNVPITRSLSYNTSITYAYNKNKITSLYYPALYAYDILEGQYVEGRPVGSVYSYTYLGMTDGVPYVEGPGKSRTPFNDISLHGRGLGLNFLNYHGTRIPPHTLGWINNFKFRNFNLMVVMVGTLGGKFRAPAYNYATNVGSRKTSVDRYVVDVINGNPDLPGFPKLNETEFYLWDRYAPYLQSLVESSSFIECKEINLEYYLPKSLVSKARFDNVKLYAQARNLGLIYNANSRGFHPDWLPGSNRPVANYTFGVNLQL